LLLLLEHHGGSEFADQFSTEENWALMITMTTMTTINHIKRPEEIKNDKFVFQSDLSLPGVVLPIDELQT